MAKIYRNYGLYMTHVRTNEYNNHLYNYMYICIFFVQNYMCFEWEPMDEPLIVNPGYLSHMAEWRNKIYEAIKSGDIDASEAKYKFSKFIEKANGNIEARFRDNQNSNEYKDIVLIPKFFGGVSLIVNINTAHYDFDFPEKNGYKENKIINMESLKFYYY